MLGWFIWENIEVDHIISAFSFSNYELIAVQFFNSILLVYYKTLKEHKTVLYWFFLRTEMTSDPSNYHREHSPKGSYSLFQFEGSHTISVFKDSIGYSFVFFKYLLVKSWHHHNTVNFFQFHDGKVFFKEWALFWDWNHKWRNSTSYTILIDIKFHIFDMHISINFYIKTQGCLR